MRRMEREARHEQRDEAILTIERANDALKKHGWLLNQMPTNRNTELKKFFPVIDQQGQEQGIFFSVNEQNPTEGRWYYHVDAGMLDEANMGLLTVSPNSVDTLEKALTNRNRLVPKTE